MNDLDSLPPWVQSRVKEMLEDLRERAARWHREKEATHRMNAEHNALVGLSDSANMRNILANEHRDAAAAILSLPLTPDAAPPEKEEAAIRAAGIEAAPMCECGHWGYEHGMLDACAVFGCDCHKRPAPSPPKESPLHHHLYVTGKGVAPYCRDCGDPAPPNAEQGERWMTPNDRRMADLEHAAKERAALLAFREALRGLLNPDGVTPVVKTAREALAQADKVVGK